MAPFVLNARPPQITSSVLCSSTDSPLKRLTLSARMQESKPYMLNLRKPHA